MNAYNVHRKTVEGKHTYTYTHAYTYTHPNTTYTYRATHTSLYISIQGFL